MFRIYFLSVILISCDFNFFITPFIMDFSQLSEENHDIVLTNFFAKMDKIVSPKELKKVKQKKESLIVQLSESHVFIDSLISENTMLLNIIDELENKLAKFSSDNLKSMLCIHSDVSNKPNLTVDDLSTSTSHALDSELDIKLVIEDTACLDNSFLINHVMPKSKESRTRGKFVPTCHNCGKIGHIRPNCHLLKSHRPWIKQDVLRKSEVKDSSSSKYVPLHRRHIKGKGNVICKNANHNSEENVKKHSNRRSLPICHHWSHPTQMSIAPGSEVEGSKGSSSKSYIRHSTSDSTSGSTASAIVCSRQSKWQTKEEQINELQEKVAEAHWLP